MPKQLDEKQQKKIKKIAEVIQDGELAIAEMIFELEDKIDRDLPALHDLMKRLKGDKGDKYEISEKDIKEIAHMAQELVDTRSLARAAANLIEIPYKDIVAEAARRIPKPKDGKTPTRSELIAMIKPLIPAPIRGDDGEDADAEEVYERLVDNLPVLGGAIRDALELIEDEEDKLDPTAIKGWEQFKTELLELAKTGQGRIIGPTRGMFLFVDGVKKGLISNLNLKAGTGMSIAYSKVNGQDTITFNSSGGGGSNGISVETPAEVPDGVITQFTVSAEPEWVVADGVTYYAGAGYSYAGLVVTMDVAPSSTIRVIVGGSSSVTVETPAEVPDGIITAFTVSAEPQWVVADGITYYEGAGYSYAALTVTMDVAPSTTIRAII